MKHLMLIIAIFLLTACVSDKKYVETRDYSGRMALCMGNYHQYFYWLILYNQQYFDGKITKEQLQDYTKGLDFYREQTFQYQVNGHN